MIEIKTESGFVCQLPKDAMDDMELVDIFTGEYPNEAFRNSDIAKHLLGNQKKAMYDHLRKIHGKVPASAVDQELREIILAFGSKGKNS